MVTREDSLSGVHAKIDRANKHIKEVHEAVAQYWKLEPHSTEWVNSKAHPGDQDLVYRILKPIPAEIPVIIGDVLHNLRSALDLLACQLARRSETGRDREVGCEGTEFPIGKSPEKFLTSLKKGKVSILGKDALDIIKGLKPYQGGDERFWRLHKLNIIDKHRLLVVASLANTEAPLETNTGGINIRIDMVQPGLGGPRIMKDGDILISKHGNLDMKFDLGFYIVFNEVGLIVMEKIESQLLLMRDAVKDALDALAPLVGMEKPG